MTASTAPAARLVPDHDGKVALDSRDPGDRRQPPAAGRRVGDRVELEECEGDPICAHLGGGNEAGIELAGPPDDQVGRHGAQRGDAPRVLDARPCLRGQPLEAAEAEPGRKPLGQADGISHLRSTTDLIPGGGQPVAGQHDAEDGRLDRRPVDEPMDAADLEDRDVAATLVLVRGQDPQEAREERTPQLRVVVRHGVDDPDRFWIARRKAEMSVIVRADQPVADDLGQALPRQQVADRVEHAVRIGPVGRRDGRGPDGRDRLVPSDAGDLLDQVRLDGR